jgi:hypothetical protein
VLAELLKYIYPSSDQSVLCDCGGGGDDLFLNISHSSSLKKVKSSLTVHFIEANSVREVLPEEF